MGTTAKSPEIGARYYRVYVLNSDGTRFKTLDKVYRKSAQAAANKAARIVATTTVTLPLKHCCVVCTVCRAGDIAVCIMERQELK